MVFVENEMQEKENNQIKKPRLLAIERILLVGSGKGGVGKSTVAVNLALTWQQQGKRVGLLDADLYGPNQPSLLGVHEKPAPQGSMPGRFQPVEVKGLATMSIGYLVEATVPLVLRGPMVSKLMEQMLFQTEWPQLDVLVIDLPPGTGDIQLSLAKKIAVDGAIIVTTPQTVSLLDARKAIEMFHKVEVPVLGIVENMATHLCRQCGHLEAIFGEAGGHQLAADCGLPLLGQLPLAAVIRQSGDRGEPIVLSATEMEISRAYQEIAKAIGLF